QAPNYSIQKRYTEDWVLQRGFQTHRRSDSSWYSENSDSSSSEGNAKLGTHRRYPSDAKTITPADFQSGRFLLAPKAELSSDADTGTSEGAWKTAPQSFTENKTGTSSPMPMLASIWASTPPPIMENRFPISNGVSDIRLEPEHPNSDLSVFGVVENGPSTNMIRTPSPLSSTEATATRTPVPNGISASLLSHTPLQLSRSGTPNIKSKKRKSKNVVKVPSYSPWGLPLEEGGRPMPLTNLEMEERSRKWEALGYTPEFLSGQGAQSRDIFLEDTKEKVKDVVVNIRDPSEWQEYCNQLREEKLRALGVILADDIPAAMPATTTARGQTPLSHQSPAPFQANPYSPPHPTQSAMSNGMGHNGSQNVNYHGHHYSPSMAQAPVHMSPIPAQANHPLPYHMPRQSMSMNPTPINHDWDLYNPNMYTPPPPQNQPTPPMMTGSVWSPAPPGPFAMRNPSPMGGMGHHSHSPSMFTPQYIMEENQDYMNMIPNEYVESQRAAAYYGHNHHLSLVGMDRFQQQQMRRGSPLAHQSGHLLEEDEQRMIDMMAIDAPVPGRRHNLSISLEKDMEGMENYQKEIETHIGHHLSNGDGFNTNPVSPAPEAMYPQHPDMPCVENDVHNGPELLSNPEDDVPDVETERQHNRQAARERTQSIGMNGQQYDSNSLPMSGSQYIPQSYQPHSRDTSLSHIQYDAIDPRENSALSMLMGTGIGTGSRRGGMLDEILSEGGRTNPSDINTNPSEPSSPRPKYTSHMRDISNNSNAWMSDTSKAPGSTTSSKKFNAQAPEFKFKPGTSFKYSPQSKPFIPSGSVNSSPIGSTTHSRKTSQDPVGFGSYGKGKLNVGAAPFRPRLFSNGSASSVFAKGAQFSPDAPVFKPKSAESISTPASKSSLPPIFSPTKEIDEPVLEKQASRPPSRTSVHKETPADVIEDDAREGNVSGGGGKRAKHGPTSSLVKDTEVPALESLRPSEDVETSDVNAADSQNATPTEETFAESSASSDEVEDVPKELPIEEEPFVMIEEGEITSFAMADANISAVPSKGEGETPLDVLDQELSAVEEAEAIAAAIPIDNRSERASTPPPAEVLEEPTPQAAAAAPDFNFDFAQAAEPVTHMEAKFGGMGESRYSHAPSPPPAHPAPSPPVSDMLPLPSERVSYASNADSYRSNPFVDPVKPMPTDSELDEVIRHLSENDPIYGNQENGMSGSEVGEQSMDEEQSAPEETQEEQQVADEDLITWRRDTPKRPAIPVFHDLTPTSHPFEQAERSAGPSPSPTRGTFQHTAATFSTDDDATYAQAQTTGEVAYQPPAQEDIGHAQPESDWDDLIPQDDSKLRPQSRLFFDAHVEEFVGDLLHSRLDPLHKSLSAIHDVLKKNQSLTLTRRGSVATSAPHSDADDEEDDTQPPRSPRKDKKSEKIKSAVVEALVMHNWSAPTEDKLAEIYSAIAKVSRAFQDSHLNDDLAETKSAILQALTKTAHTDEIDLTKLEILAAIKRTAKSNDMEDLKTSFARSVSKIAQVEDIASIREAMEEVAQISDIVGMKLELRDSLISTAQKSDIEDLKSILSKVPEKGDLECLQDITVSGFAKAVKANDIVELKNSLSEVIRTIHTTDVRGDVQQVYELTRDNAMDTNLYQQAQENFIRESHNNVSKSLDTIQTSVHDVQKLVQQRGQKEDMRRSLQEDDQKQNFTDIKTYIGEVNNNLVDVVARVQKVDDIRLVVGNISDSQPRLADIKDVFEEVVRGQPTLGQVKSVVEDVVNRQPTIEELKSIVEGATSKQPTIEELKSVVEEVAKTQPTIEDLRSVVEEVANKQTVEELRVAVEEAFNRQPTIDDLRLVVEEASNNQPTLYDVKNAMEEVTDCLPKMDALRSMMEELLSKHRTVTVTKATEHANTEALLLKVAGLEKMLDEAGSRAEAESQARREAHERTLELESRLRIAEEEAARYRDKAEESDRRLKANDDKRYQALTQSQMRVALLEGAHSALQKSVGELSARNANLEGSIREAQSASERNKEEANRMEDENRELRRVIESLKAEMEERGHADRGIQHRPGTRKARVAAEVTVKEGLESEVRRLEVEQKEAIKLKVEYEQLKRSNGKLEEMLDKFREEAVEHSQRAASLAHEKTKAALSQESTESKSLVVQEQHQKYEKQLLELRQRFEDTRSQNDRALRIATEDGEREAIYLNQRLDISQSEVQHLREKSKDLREQTKDLREHISLLKDQLKIATSAAQAAAQAAATSRAPQAVSEERALRESVNVLQEQLQQREARIEELEQQLSKFDKADIKRKDEQITWLRELLDVRVDELEEIVHALSMPHFDRESVRDTALRLRANLQMEQREKEMSITPSRGAIAPVTSLASRLPGVASSAASSAAGWWNSKNKGPSSVAHSSPSRPGSAAGFLNGILAPAPPTTLANAQRMGSRLARGISSETGSNSSHTTITSRYREKQTAVPSYRAERGGSRRMQHHLFQKGLYDADADADANDSVMSGEFYEDEDNGTETGADDGDMPYRPGSYRH
ncbi:uncharacterized protein H6S33_010178, partial [Morchella sextelata]|uniref:uncharacterized protein n=1 Tax=Morchella sextelata TaxID=1174677 RepID=UPI001D044BCB